MNYKTLGLSLLLAITSISNMAYAQPVSDSFDGFKEVETADGGTAIVDSGGNMLGFEAAEAKGLDKKFIFGETLTAKNAGEASTLDLGNDPLIGKAPEMPAEMRMDMKNKDPDASALFGAEKSASTSTTNLGGAAGTEALNLNTSLGAIPNSQGLAQRSTMINTTQGLAKYALESMDPSAANAVNAEYQSTLQLAALANQALSNLRSTLQSQGPAGEIALRGLETCLAQQGATSVTSANQAVVLLQCLGLNANGNSVMMASAGSSGGGLGGIFDAINGAFNTVNGYVNTANGYINSAGQLVNQAGSLANLAQNPGQIVDGIKQAGGGVLNNAGQVVNNAGQVFNNGKNVATNTTNSTTTTKPLTSRSALTRSATSDSSIQAVARNLFTGGAKTISSAVCDSISAGISSSDQTATCNTEAKVAERGGSIKTAVRNSYLIFPTNSDSADLQKKLREDYQNYFGDQCLVCAEGGKDQYGNDFTGGMRLEVVRVQPKEKLPKHFREINMEIYEALRIAMMHKCYFDNGQGGFGASAGGTTGAKTAEDVFRVIGQAGETKNIYDDGIFWRSQSANKSGTSVNKMPGGKSVRETLQYLSFPGFTLTPAIMDSLYDVLVGKNTIDTYTTASVGGTGYENVSCENILGPSMDWTAIYKKISDASSEESLSLQRAVKALYNFSQRLTLGKVYDACQQSLQVVQRKQVPALNLQAAVEGILAVCSKDSGNPEIFAEARDDNIAQLGVVVDRLYAEQASDSGRSGSAVAKAFKGEKSEAKSQGG